MSPLDPNIRVNHDLLAQLRKLSILSGISPSSFANDAIAAFLEENFEDLLRQYSEATIKEFSVSTLRKNSPSKTK
jgi:hypothetical protein